MWRWQIDHYCLCLLAHQKWKFIVDVDFLCKIEKRIILKGLLYCVCIFLLCYKKKLSKLIKKKNNTPYTSKQPLMIAYEGSESAWDNFRKFIHQFQPETKTFIRKLERILYKWYRQNLSLLFNEMRLNEWLLPNFTYFIYICIFSFIFYYTGENYMHRHLKTFPLLHFILRLFKAPTIRPPASHHENYTS